MTLIREGALGTGKTVWLKERISALIEARPLGAVLVIARSSEAAQSIRAALDVQQSDLCIGSVREVAENILRDFPELADVSLDFTTISPTESRALLKEVLDTWLAAVSSRLPPGVRHVLLTKPARYGAPSGYDRLVELSWQLALRRHQSREVNGSARRVDASVLDNLFERMRALHAVATQLGNDTEDFLGKNLVDIARSYERIGRRRSLGTADDDLIRRELCLLSGCSSWRWRGKAPSLGGIERNIVLSMRNDLKSVLDTYVVGVQSEMRDRLREELVPVTAQFQAIKLRHNLLDPWDISEQAATLTKAQGTVRETLQQRFEHVLVDDFHALSFTEAEMVLLWSAQDPSASSWTQAIPKPGKLVLTADPVETQLRSDDGSREAYPAFRQHLLTHGADVTACHARRSTSGLITLVNTAFGQALSTHGLLLQPSCDARPKSSLVALSVHCPDAGYRRVLPFQIEQAFPAAIARFLHGVLHGDSIPLLGVSNTPQLRPLPEDICLLFSRRDNEDGEDVRIPYMRALEAVGLSYAAKESASSFQGREEIRAIYHLLLAIEQPHDELAMYAVLRGPFFGFSDESLFLYRSRYGSLRVSPAQIPLTLELEEAETDLQLLDIAKVIEGFQRFHGQLLQLPILDLLNNALDWVGAEITLAFWSAGDQALRSVHRVRQLATKLEVTGQSFSALVAHLDREGSLSHPTLETIDPAASNLHLLSIAEAVGRDFAVVIACEPTAPSNSLYPAYVAASCAREMLVVPHLAKAPIEGWLTPLNRALSGASLVSHVRPWSPEHMKPSSDVWHRVRHTRVLQEHPLPDSTPYDAYRAWARRQKEIRTASSVPSMRIAQSVDAPSLPENGFVRLETYYVEAPFLSASLDLSALIGRVLAVAPLERKDVPYDAYFAHFAHIEGYTSDEAEAAHRITSLLLEHPMLRTMFTSDDNKNVYRQVPIVRAGTDGGVIESTCDFLVHHAKADVPWTVINVRTAAAHHAAEPSHEDALAHCAHGIYAHKKAPTLGLLFLLPA